MTQLDVEKALEDIILFRIPGWSSLKVDDVTVTLLG